MCPDCISVIAVAVVAATPLSVVKALLASIATPRETTVVSARAKESIRHDYQTEHPKVVSRGEWLAARKELLVQEKQSTRQRDQMDGRRRELPWVRVRYLIPIPHTAGEMRWWTPRICIST